MKTGRNRRSKDGSGFPAELKRVVEHIVATTPLPRLFELYYWAQEPALLRLLRHLVSLTTEDRKAIEAFLKLATDNSVVTITRQSPGRLVLEAKHADGLVSDFAHRRDDEELSSSQKKLN
jgi:hypothetical protein